MDPVTSMHVDTFDAEGKYARPCCQCARLGMVRERTEHGNEQVVCPHCGCKAPWIKLLYLKQTHTTRRKPYPLDASLDEVWARFDDRCVVCSRTKDELAVLRVGRERQHVVPYADAQHRGPIVPICGRCHAIATVLQKDAAVMRGFIRYSRTHDELLPLGGPGLSPDGLSPDSLRAEGETSPGALEGFSNDDADV